MSDSTVKVRNLKKVYEGGFEAVNGISFDVDDGEVLGIIGPNGAGKTSTIKMISGLIEPTSGSGRIAGRSIEDVKMKKNLGFLPEESPAYDSMTATSYLKFFADLYDVPKKQAKGRINSILDDLDLEYRDRRIGDLSKGMTRKVLIARSLINDPQVLVYDEPASGLDPYTTNFIVEYIRELADTGKVVIFSAHNLYHVESLCDRVVILNEGEVLAEGSIPDIRSNHGSKKYDLILSEPLAGAQKTTDGYRLRVDSREEVESVKEDAKSRNVNVEDVFSVEPSLEDIFLDLINAGDRSEE